MHRINHSHRCTLSNNAACVTTKPCTTQSPQGHLVCGEERILGMGLEITLVYEHTHSFPGHKTLHIQFFLATNISDWIEASKEMHKYTDVKPMYMFSRCGYQFLKKWMWMQCGCKTAGRYRSLQFYLFQSHFVHWQHRPFFHGCHHWSDHSHTGTASWLLANALDFLCSYINYHHNRGLTWSNNES